MSTGIDDLNRGFRHDYLDYERLTGQLEAWVTAFPSLVHLRSLGRTREGRDIWLLTVGHEPERARPAVWVDGNMHAMELAGSSVALAIAETAIRLHVAPESLPDGLGLTAAMQERLREVLFHVLPRMSPDGAERVLATGRYVRSIPGAAIAHRERPYWRLADIDGDGLSLRLRQRDAAGEYVESRDFPGRMLLREIEDEGPFYKLYPEGLIENFDGETVPTPHFLDDNPTDLNRNFPYSWMPQHEQEGAGDYPLHEAESRAVVEFTSAAPHIFAWLNLHTFGGVLIRPLGHKPDSDMDQSDLALYRQLEEWATRHTGYPTVGGFEEFTYLPTRPIFGDIIDYAYHQRGCLAWVCELWDLFEQAGLPRQKRFVERYVKLDRADVEKIYRWDAEHNEGRLAGRWRAFEHPQLGAVEVGGPDTRIGMWNPPPDRLGTVCDGQVATFLRVAALAPRLEVEVEVQDLGEGLQRLRCTVANSGYLSTCILESARKFDWNEPVTAMLTLDGGRLEGGARPRVRVGHLEGWGRGRHDGSAGPAYQGSRGNAHRASLSWVVRGPGTARIRVGSPRCGWQEREIALAPER